MLDVNELFILETKLSEEIVEHLTEILTRLNREGELDTLLELLGMSNLLQNNSGYKPYNTGKILVVGYSKLSPRDLIAIGKTLGISKDRFEFHLDYDDGIKYDFKNIQYSQSYSVILAGPMPHSCKAKGKYGSAISAIEHQDGYPPIIRLGTNELKITKSNFRNTLEDLINHGKLAA